MATQNELIQLITDALAKNPSTGSEAILLYKELSNKLATHLVNNIPTIEEKIIALEGLLVKDVKQGYSWCCKPKKK